MWTPELAYATGLLATDGNLSNDGRHIAMRSADYDLLETFRACLHLKNKIGTTDHGRRDHMYRVQFGSVQFYNWLTTIGLTQAETYTIGSIQIPDEFFRDFLRGHLDGDGNSGGLLRFRISAISDHDLKYSSLLSRIILLFLQKFSIGTSSNLPTNDDIKKKGEQAVAAPR